MLHTVRLWLGNFVPAAWLPLRSLRACLKTGFGPSSSSSFSSSSSVFQGIRGRERRRERGRFTFHFPLVAFGLSLALLTGCGKTPTQDSKSPAQPSTINHQPSTAPILRFHWLGKQRLAADPGATNFMAIWNLPESARLEAQTLDKLATAPWRLGQTNLAVSNAPTALLRPLLDDLVQAESYLEGWGDTNHPGEFVFAIRLSAARAALWETNLPQILTSLSASSSPAGAGEDVPRTGEGRQGVIKSEGAGRGEVATPKTFNLQLSTFNAQLTLTRSNDWTLVAFSTPSPLAPRSREGERMSAGQVRDDRGETISAGAGRGEVQSTNTSQPSTLLAAFRSRIAATQQPFPPRTTNYMVEAELDLRAATEVFGLGWRLPGKPPRVTLVAMGDGSNIRVTGEVVFPGPMPIRLEPWNIPTNLIHDPLIAFSTARGIATWADLLKQAAPINFAETPDQMISWAVAGYPLQTYFAVPLSQSTNAIRLVSAALTEQLAAPEKRNFPGRFITETNFERMIMEGIPFMTPRLETVHDSAGEFLLGSFIPMMRTNHPMPVALLAQLLTKPKLVYYDWEITGPRIEAWTYIGQTLRLVFDRAQLPPNSAGFKWLQALLPRLGNSATSVMAVSDTRWDFSRTSTIGFTGVELHLLADWLESPNFPAGLHTDQAQPKRGLSPAPVRKR